MIRALALAALLAAPGPAFARWSPTGPLIARLGRERTATVIVRPYLRQGRWVQGHRRRPPTAPADRGANIAHPESDAAR